MSEAGTTTEATEDEGVNIEDAAVEEESETDEAA